MIPMSMLNAKAILALRTLSDTNNFEKTNLETPSNTIHNKDWRGEIWFITSYWTQAYLEEQTEKQVFEIGR